jgi:DNA replication ATP-dependent helicase Dna2
MYHTEKIIGNSIAHYIYAQLQEIIDSPISVQYAIIEVGSVYSFLLKELTRNETQFFANAYTKTVFVFDNYHVPLAISQPLQKLRHWVTALSRQQTDLTTDDALPFAVRAVCRLTDFFAHQAPPDALATYCHYGQLATDEPDTPTDTPNTIALLSVVALDASRIEKDAQQQAYFYLTAKNTDSPAQELHIKIDGTFMYLQPIIWRYAKLTFTQLISLDPSDAPKLPSSTTNRPTILYGLSPETLVALDPDCLIDASTIAACRLRDKVVDIQYLIDKFHHNATNKYFLRGSVVNEYLDQYMSQQNANVEAVFDSIIQQKPTYALIFNENDKDEILNEIKRQIHTLHTDFVRPYRKHQLSLEPTFISEIYGLRGRLDVLVRYADNALRKDVIELKSGKDPKKFNRFIEPKDAMQATCYNLLLDSAYEQRTGTSAILYAAAATNDNPLRNAPNDITAKRAVLKTRNQIAWFDYVLTQNPKRILDFINLKYFENAGLFDNQSKLIASFRRDMDNAAPHEIAYFYEFVRFIAREHRAVRVGAATDRNTGGFAALWNQNIIEKEKTYNLLAFLCLRDVFQPTSKYPSDFDDPNPNPNDDWHKHRHSSHILFRFDKTPRTIPISSFRTGDFILLYPQEPNGDLQPTKHQVIKATIRENTNDWVIVSPINQYIALDYFDQCKYWAIEPEGNEMGLGSMYQSMRQFLTLPQTKKDLLLGKQKPTTKPIEQWIDAPDLKERQNELLQQALSAQDYFLLQGPPGTGKTKVMLRELVTRLLQDPNEHIVLLAYTNRAVDEICEALQLIEPTPIFIRLGYGDTTEHKAHLLSNYAKNKSITEIKKHINSCRIIVSTILTWIRNPELAQYTHFTTAIIDEASQLLEPQIIGVLGQVSRFILIGDEKQLPAVVTQADANVPTDSAALHKLGIRNLCVSMFERLLLTCQQNGWTHAYGMLEHQGRMHRTIQEFPNKAYYNNLLKPISERQIADIKPFYGDAQHHIVRIMGQSRTIFVDTPIENRRNVNQTEAKLTAELVAELYNLLGSEQTDAVGIITPYRAQIAEIQNQLPKHLRQWASIDTVERYQGSQRDIIIISAAVNHAYQLQSLHVLSDDKTVDKKLNVALTRAREHLIIIGNQALLQQSHIYKALLSHYKEYGVIINFQ